jgi:hypothetical protein
MDFMALNKIFLLVTFKIKNFQKGKFILNYS